MHFAVHRVKALYSLDQITWTFGLQVQVIISWTKMGCINPWTNSSWTTLLKKPLKFQWNFIEIPVFSTEALNFTEISVKFQ